jgi:4'-phosphopantetheinyl transferase
MLIAPIQMLSVGRWPSDVEVSRVELDLRLDIGTGDACRFLSADEHERMARYVQHADRVRFAVARSVLREILGERLACDPAQLEFATGAYGRPSLAAHPDVSFNVSHSGERVLIALSMVRTVGADIEVANPSLDWRSLINLVCAPEEAHHVLTVRDFYRCWTAKEALLKATGVGIGEGLKSIDLANARVPPTLGFTWLDELDGYVAAVAFGTCATFATR